MNNEIEESHQHLGAVYEKAKQRNKTDDYGMVLLESESTEQVVYPRLYVRIRKFALALVFTFKIQ